MNRNTQRDHRASHYRQGDRKKSSAARAAPTPKVFLYTIPAIVLALFAWLVFSKVQARQRVRAETVYRCGGRW